MPHGRSTHLGPADPPQDLLSAAVNVCRARFGAAALPMLFLPAWTTHTAASILRLAVARGRPVRPWTAARACGNRRALSCPVTWESPRVLALIVSVTATVFGTAAGMAGYKLGSTPPAPPLIVVFQPGPIRIELPGTTPGSWP